MTILMLIGLVIAYGVADECWEHIRTIGVRAEQRRQDDYDRDHRS